MNILDFENFDIDVEQAVLWQYQNAKNLRILISNKQAWLELNYSAFWTDWLTNTFDLTTKNPTVFGMVVWSIILNIPVYIPTAEEGDKPVWGFNAFLITDLSDTSVLSEGMSVTGTGIPSDSIVSGIVDSTTIKLSSMATSTGVQSLTFSLTQPCETTDTSPVLVVQNSSILSVGMDVTGTGIPGSTTILNIIDATSVTLSNNATATGTPTLTFSLTENGTLDIPGLENTYKNFGTTFTDNPGSGNFSTRGQFRALTIQQQQFLLRVRYFQLTNLGDVNDINQFFNVLCTNNDIGFTGTIYAVDNFDMTMNYVFTTDDFPGSLFAVLIDLDVLPRPAGVAII